MSSRATATANDSTDLRTRLRDVQAAKTQARSERAACDQALAKARSGLAKLNCTPSEITSKPEFKSAEKAREALQAADATLEKLGEAEVGLLQLLGESGGNRGGRDRNGPTLDGHDGWATVANELSLADGRNRVNVPLGDLMRSPAMAAVKVTPSSGLTAPAIEAPFTQSARDERHIWTVFPSGEPVDVEIAAITDYRQKGSRTVTGSVERDPVATTSKAKLGLEVELVSAPLKQFAVVIEKVPAKLFDFIPVFQAFLNNEAAYQVSLALDAHCLAQIAAATPASGLEGATLIEQARNGVAAMRERGANPTVLALNPTDAAALDVQKSTGSAEYIFATRDSGSSSPLFGNTIVEVPDLTAPLLIDRAILGVVYSGMATFLADPFSGLDTNEVRLRVEMEALLHIRDIAGAFLIEDD
jgi:hypothetical protein